MTIGTLTGGSFMDSGGNPLANGWITFELSAPTTDLTGEVQICNSFSVKYMLDANGNVESSPTPFLYPSTQMLPNTPYTVRVYTSKGQLAWGPNVVRLGLGPPSNSTSILLENMIPGNPA